LIENSDCTGENRNVEMSVKYTFGTPNPKGTSKAEEEARTTCYDQVPGGENGVLDYTKSKKPFKKDAP